MSTTAVELCRRPRVEVVAPGGQLCIVSYPRTEGHVAKLRQEALALGGTLTVRYKGGNREPVSAASRKSNAAVFARGRKA